MSNTLSNPKPGIKTTEFYLTAVNSVTGILVMLGYLTPVQAGDLESAIAQVIGGSLVIFSTIAYIYSRVAVKRTVDLTSTELPPLPMSDGVSQSQGGVYVE